MTDFFNLRHMSLAAEAVATRSVSAAAERVHMTQPAASQGIARLEGELGAKLFLRQSGTLLPTEAGEIIAARIEQALAFIDQGADAIGRRSGKATHGRAVHRVTAAQLRALVAVSDAGSFTLAAQSLGVAQPSVHRRARTLEQIVEVPLFRAARGGVELTSEGQTLVRHVKLAHAELRQGLEELASLKGDAQARFTIGSLPLPRSEILPQAIDALVRTRSRLQVRVIDGRYAELLRALREGDIDCLVGALREPPPADDVVEEPLFSDDLVLIAGRDHPLVGQSDTTLEDTLTYPWIAPPKTTPSGQYLFDALRIHEQPATPVRVVSSSLVLVRQMLNRGNYVSIISRHQIDHEVQAGNIAVLSVPLPDSARAIGITTRAAWRPTRAQADVIAQIRAAAQSVQPA
ncbi:MAG: LysR family transcriptional regulator [Pseudomonadota bacterium]